MYNCGDLLKDKLTGYEGLVICKAHFQFNEPKYALRPIDLKEDEMRDPTWFDEYQLELSIKSKFEPKFIDTSIINKLPYGTKVKHINTNFSGIVTGYDFWFNGCLRFHVQPQTLHEGKIIEYECFCFEELKIISNVNKDTINIKDNMDIKKPSGGPTVNPKMFNRSL